MPDETKQIMNEKIKTRIYNEAMTMSVYCHAHPLTSLRDALRKRNVVTSQELRHLPTGSTVRVSGMLIIVHTPPTKSGKRVMFITMEDEWGLIDVAVFSKAQNRFAKLILTSEVLTLEGRLQRKGPTGNSISIVMEKALIGLSGSLARLLGNGLKVTIPKVKKDSRTPIQKKVGSENDEADSSVQLWMGY